MDLAAVAKNMQHWLSYSMNRFVPETILIVGFLLAIIMDLFIRRQESKKFTGYFVLFVFVASGVAAAMQWLPANPASVKAWEGGKLIFPYTQTLFSPQEDPRGGGVFMNYAMIVVDNFSVFFKMLISLTGVFIVLISLGSNEIGERKTRLGEYYSLLLAMAVGMYLMPASTDLLMMYISLELVSISSYILAGFMKDETRSIEASMKYLLYGAFSSGLMIYGFSLLYGLTGTTNIVAINQVLSVTARAGQSTNSLGLWVATILSMAGMGYKISAAPFHFWTPDVYEGAPIPVTALLSVASKAAGFGLLMRFLLFTFPASPVTGSPIIDWQLMVAVLAAITMSLGNFAALQQSNIKRMLAYSTIAHAGYMLVGLVAAGMQVYAYGKSPAGMGYAGVVSILIYFVAYLFMNIGAFYVVMLIENKLGSEEIEDYRGMAKRSPLLAVSLAIFLVSLTGIPLTVGFIGKLFVFTSILQRDPMTHQIKFLWLAVVAVLNSVVSLYYYVRVMAAMFIKKSTEDEMADQAGMTVSSDGALTFGWQSKALIFSFIVPVLVLGVFFQPLVSFTENVIRFFSMQ